MTRSTVWAPLAAAAFLFSLGLAACDPGDVEQQSSKPAAEQPGDAAATPESATPESEIPKSE